MPRASSTDWQRPSTTTLDRPKPPGAYFDEAAADRAVAFFRLLPHVKGRWAGQPFDLEPWQEHEIVRPIFGWRNADGTRLYRECYVRIARKGGKSTLAAGIAGYLTYADGEAGAEVYSAAVDKDQARIVFGALSEMVRSSPSLAKRSRVMRNAIVIPKTAASYKVLSADAPNKHGLNASGVIVDELHAHAKRDLFDVLSTSTGARTQPLVFSITTAGVYDQNGICVEKDDYTRKVAAGVIDDPAFLGVIYALEEGEDWTDEKTWIKANPGMTGGHPSLEYLRRERDKAMASVAAQNTFRMLHCNQWVQQATRWIDLGLWDENAGLVVEPDLAGAVAYGGLDLASVSDLTAWVLAFPKDDGSVDILARHFLPEAALEVGPNAALYREWHSKGLLQTTPGNATDYAFVKERVIQDCAKFDVRGVNIDHLFQGQQLAGELLDEGVPVIAFRQNFTAFAMPMKEFERLLLERQLHHGGNPMLRWQADNVVVRSDPSGNLKPDKDKSGNKIDGIVAAVMAIAPIAEEETEPWVLTF
jgi:phage terminase large subunit-like protein